MLWDIRLYNPVEVIQCFEEHVPSCLDADMLLNPHACKHILEHFRIEFCNSMN